MGSLMHQRKRRKRGAVSTGPKPRASCPAGRRQTIKQSIVSSLTRVRFGSLLHERKRRKRGAVSTRSQPRASCPAGRRRQTIKQSIVSIHGSDSDVFTPRVKGALQLLTNRCRVNSLCSGT